MSELNFDGMFVEPSVQYNLQDQARRLVAAAVAAALEEDRVGVLKEFRIVRCVCGDPIRIAEDGAVWTLGGMYHRCPQVKAPGSFKDTP